MLDAKDEQVAMDQGVHFPYVTTNAEEDPEASVTFASEDDGSWVQGGNGEWVHVDDDSEDSDGTKTGQGIENIERMIESTWVGHYIAFRRLAELRQHPSQRCRISGAAVVEELDVAQSNPIAHRMCLCSFLQSSAQSLVDALQSAVERL